MLTLLAPMKRTKLRASGLTFIYKEGSTPRPVPSS